MVIDLTNIERLISWITATIPGRVKPSAKASAKAERVIARVSTDPIAALMASRL